MACLICRNEDIALFGEGKGYRLMQCGHCSFRFISPRPTEQELADFYASYSANTHDYERKTERKVERARKRLGKYAQLAPGKRFIDIGCSIGTAVAAAQTLGFEAYGVDMDRQSIRFAQGKFPGATFLAGPLESLPDEWGKFDFIYASEVLEHLPDPHLLLDTIRAHATERALLYITVPDAGHLLVPGNGLMPGSFFDWNSYVPPEHLNYFTRANMRRLLADHGFEVLKIEWDLKPGIKAIARCR